jgi:processive 1,2-diacylglycerol beta-glucosyltransferase
MGKTLILHASFGAGHEQAAKALREAFKEIAPAEHTYVADALDFSSKVLKSISMNFYLNLVKKAPLLWGFYYKQYDRERSRFQNDARALFYSISLRKLELFLNRMRPDRIICTHFLPSERLTNLIARKKLKKIPQLSCVLTDYCTHHLSVYPGMDIYFAPSEEAGRELTYTGIPAEKVVVSGIPISSRFSRMDVQKVEEKKKTLGLTAGKPAVLCMSGGFGTGPFEEILDSFHEHGFNGQLVVICGRNVKLQKQLEAKVKGWDMFIRILGFTTEIQDYYALSDLIVTKPGGLTSTEILAAKKPLVIIAPIPGQEERNCDYLLENGAAVRCHSSQDVGARVNELLKAPGRLQLMSENAGKLARPDAALTIAKACLSRGVA